MANALGPAAGAVISGVLSWLAGRQRRKLADLPTTPAAALFAGRNEVKGRVWAAEPLRSKRMQAASVTWRWTMEEERERTVHDTHTDSKGNTTTSTRTVREWHEIESTGESLPTFEIVDQSGSATVAGELGTVSLQSVYNETFSRDLGNGGGLLAKIFSTDNRTGRYREREEVMAIGTEVFAIGFAVLDDRTGTPVLASGDGARLTVSTRTEESRTMTWRVLGTIALVVAIALAGVTSAVFFGRAELGIWPGPFPGLLVAAVVGLAGFCITLYNRLQIVGQMADRAFALVGVQLKRRAELIPLLAEVAAASAVHERELLATAAQARSTSGLTTVAALDTEVGAQTAQLSSLVVLAEAYPELKGNQSWRYLADQLALTENRIAASRHFYNDSVTLLRTRRQQFPGVLIAHWLPAGRSELFAAGVAERSVPQVSRQF